MDDPLSGLSQILEAGSQVSSFKQRIRVLSILCCSLMCAHASARLHQLSTLIRLVASSGQQLKSVAAQAMHATQRTHASARNSL